MECPRDGTEMGYQGFWKYPRHSCGQCGGVFVNEKDLAYNLGHEPHVSFATVAEVKLDNLADSGLACPADGTVLKVVRFADNEVDACPACRSIWLDKGEYEKIVAKVERQLDARRQNVPIPTRAQRAAQLREADRQESAAGGMDAADALGEFVDWFRFFWRRLR